MSCLKMCPQCNAAACRGLTCPKSEGKLEGDGEGSLYKEGSLYNLGIVTITIAVDS